MLNNMDTTVENVIDEKNYLWKKEQELLLKKWANKAICFKVMHDRSMQKYWCLNNWFNIPIIIISTITGSTNFVVPSLERYQDLLMFIIGAFNIFSAILVSISTFLGNSQKIESHKLASISWDKVVRKIQIELAKKRNDRIEAKLFIKYITDEYDHIIHISPIIPNDIIIWFTNIVESNQLEPILCCFDYSNTCLPCNCNLCRCFQCFTVKKSSPTNKYFNTITWDKIEIPEIILGRINPINIAIPDNEMSETG